MLHDGVAHRRYGQYLPSAASGAAAQGAHRLGDLLPNGAGHPGQTVWSGIGILDAGNHVGAEDPLAVHAALCSQQRTGGQIVERDHHRGGSDIDRRAQPAALRNGDPGLQGDGAGSALADDAGLPERVQGHGTIAGQPGTAGQTALAAGREQRALLRIGRRHRTGDGGQTLPAGPVAAAGGLRFPQAGPLKGAEQRFAGPAFDRMSPVRPMYGNNRHESPPETVK